MKHVDITNHPKGNIHIVNVAGFMDMVEVPKLEQALDALIKEGTIKIVLDLSGLEYVSSAGLGAIIGRIREVRRSGGDIKIGGYSEMVYNILETFGFTQVFETYTSREEATLKFEA